MTVLAAPSASGPAAGRKTWRSRPTWYLIAPDDRMIPPPAQRTMAEPAGATIAEVPGSHSIYVSQPAAVADLITQAAQSVPEPDGST